MGFFDPKEQEMESSSTVGLPEEYQPYLRTGLDRSLGLLDTPREIFEGPMSAGMDPRRTAGLESIYGLASEGGAVAPSAIQELNRTLSGEYLSPSAIETATRGQVNRFVPRANAAFYGSGGGGALRAGTMAEGIGNVMSDYYSGERNRMMQGLNLAPAINRMGYDPGERMIDVGMAYEADENRRIAEDMYRHQFAQEEPRQRVAEYNQALGGLLPFAPREQVNQWTEYGSSPFESMLGIAGTAASLTGPSGFGLWGGGGGGPIGMFGGGGRDAGGYTPFSWHGGRKYY